MPLNTDFNVPPYNDDFNEDKNFHRVIYQPGLPVQGRELTQQQTILQNQIERFGNHIFKDGSIVDGCAITYLSNVHYISLEDNFTTNSTFLVSELDYTYLITNSEDSNTAVRAIVRIAKDGIKSDYPETNRIYVSYLTVGGSNNEITEFAPGDTLYLYSSDQNKLAELDSNNLIDTIETLESNSVFDSNGYSYCVKCSDGIIFQKGFFIKVNPHTITVSDFSTNVSSYVVGFDTTEEIINELEDETLYDNALGYENENAPGAHRLKLTANLVAKEKTDVANNKNFFTIIEFDGGLPVEQKDDPSYNKLQETLSSRTYEESGDYVLENFHIEPRINDANSSTFFYEISPGVAYVRGNRIEKLATTKILTDRAITTEYALNQIITANYGNYVICDEFLGAFDHDQLDEVDIYDTPQNAITTISGINSAATGNLIGKANVKAIVFESGTKGSPTAKYLVYLFNIRMDSGKSFSNDAKSLVSAGSYGNTKADFVLENSLAVLKESDNSELLFHNGLFATKTLTNNTGLGDTSFVYNQTKSGTLDATGNCTITLISPSATGGVEKLNSSVGSTLTGSLLEQYNLYTSANSYTANLDGTISISDTVATIEGTSTTFDTDYVVGSLMRVNVNSSAQEIRRIVSISNSTYLTINEPFSVANTTANYQKFFIVGSPLPLTSVTIDSNTQFTAALSYDLDSGSQSVYASYPVRRTEAQPISKVVRKARYVKIDCTSNTTGPWNIGFADIHKLNHVYVSNTSDPYSTSLDKINWFELDTGQRDEFYDHGRLIVKSQYAQNINANTRILIDFDYFYANTSPGVGFFSVESYPVDDANTANTSAIQTIEIPTYKDYDLRNYIDFRPSKANTAADATSAGSATENPASANSNTFVVPASGHHMIIPDNNFEADFEYYLPRIDLITLNSSGRFNVIKGVPATTPRTPFVENDQSAIAECYIQAYPSATKREADEYDNVKSTKITLKTNRRYTMRDIGVLDERLKRAEFYITMNTLEQQARDMTILDTNGLNRFKNGIFADPFNSHNIGNVSDFEYKIAIDPIEKVARPFFNKHDIDFSWNSANSSNVQQTGQILTLPYESELYFQQRFATNYRVVTESWWQWNTTALLYPSYDIFRDEDSLPNINLNGGIVIPWDEFNSGPYGTIYGDWRTIYSNTSSSSASQTTNTGNTSTTITTTTTQQQTISQLVSGSTLSDTVQVGSYIRDITINPYIREQEIGFMAFGVKPNTILHVFFDDVNVDGYVAPAEIIDSDVTVYQGLINKKINRTSDYGTELISDSNGFVCGIFRVPAETFRTGDRILEITNVDNLITGADAKITIARGRFTADDLQVTRENTTLTVSQPIISNSQQTTDITTEVTTINTTVLDNVFWGDGGDGGGGGGGDPLTQSFFVENVPASISGIFITQIGLFFKKKDPSLGCSVLISEMKDGYPDNTKIIGRGYLTSDNITVSSDGSEESIFVLDNLVYLMNNKEYAFTIYPDANSPEYEVWVGKTGNFDVVTGEQVFSNPYIGNMFISSNQRSWTAIQKEDVKFKIYRAKFNVSSGYAVFDNEDDEYLTIDGFTRVNENVGVRVGDIIMTVNDSISTVTDTNVVSNTLIANSTNGFPTGRVQYINEADGFIWVDSSTGGFSNTTNPMIAIYRPSDSTNTDNFTIDSLISYGTIQSVDDLLYHAVVPKFGVLQPTRTSLSYEFKGTRSTDDTIDTNYQTVTNDLEYEYSDYERHLMSKSNESSKTSKFKVTLESTSEYSSPVISLAKKAGFFIENIINNDTTNEHTRYGNALSKYVSKRIILQEGQDAEDLRLTFTAYRPYETDVKIYAKFRNREDSEEFNDKVWSEMTYENDGDLVYSSPGNSKDYIEYTAIMPSINVVATGAFSNASSNTYNPLTGTVTIANNSTEIIGSGTSFTTELTVGDVIKVDSDEYFAIRTVTSISNNTYMTVNLGLEESNSASLFYIFDGGGNEGIVEYNNSANSRFVGYKEVAIKLVLTSSNPVKVPKINDYRGICLQV